MCLDKKHETWTGSHDTMQKLFLLAHGVGKASFALPRDLWNVFPGGVPYIIFVP